MLFNPDLPLLGRLVHSLIGQVAKIYIVDNSPISHESFVSSLDCNQARIVYLPLGDNIGIAAAQNIGISRGMRDGCSHVLLLDQDSSLPPDMVQKQLAAEQRLLENGEQVAAVGPIFIDEKTGQYPRAVRRLIQRTRAVHLEKTGDAGSADWLMASGLLIRSTTLSAVGLMREDLFIDLVDTEWGLRAKMRGYTSFMLPDVRMLHSTGDSATHVFGREIFLHSDVRHYYIVRNSIYLLRDRNMRIGWKAVTAAKIPSYILVYSLYSDHQLKAVSLLCRAVIHGCLGKLGRLN